jgi:4-hydroxy-tetrahydrodipicolinate synthase
MANVNPKAIADLAARWQEPTADQSQEALTALRSVYAQYPMIPAMKAAVAHYSKDPEWARVRPPLLALKPSEQSKLIAELEKIGFQMPGL